MLKNSLGTDFVIEIMHQFMRIEARVDGINAVVIKCQNSHKVLIDLLLSCS